MATLAHRTHRGPRHRRQIIVWTADEQLRQVPARKQRGEVESERHRDVHQQGQISSDFHVDRALERQRFVAKSPVQQPDRLEKGYFVEFFHFRDFFNPPQWSKLLTQKLKQFSHFKFTLTRPPLTSGVLANLWQCFFQKTEKFRLFSFLSLSSTEVFFGSKGAIQF